MQINMSFWHALVWTLVLICADARADDGSNIEKNCKFDKNAILTQDLATFDQSSEGHEGLAEKFPDCDSAIADLIAEYRERHPEVLKKFSSYLLYWHEGQYRAFAGQYKQAESLFEKSRLQDNSLGHIWNLYVDATKSFVRRDHPALLKAQAELASLPPAAYQPDPQPMNLDVVDGLVKCFDRSYTDAYLKCREKKPGL